MLGILGGVDANTTLSRSYPRIVGSLLADSPPLAAALEHGRELDAHAGGEGHDGDHHVLQTVEPL